MTKLIIARHGNTFSSDDTPTRVGKRTDLPLVESGIAQASKIGEYLLQNNILPDKVYCSHLKRTRETADVAIFHAGVNEKPESIELFDEIDYGSDENKVEADVIARIGAHAIEAWDKHAIVPDGWDVNPAAIIKGWHDFAADILLRDYKTVLVVTSNGIARFAPHLTSDFEGFKAGHDIKLKTGALGILSFENSIWSIEEWNLRP